MVLTAAISALHQNIYTTKHTLITCTIMTIMILTNMNPQKKRKKWMIRNNQLTSTWSYQKSPCELGEEKKRVLIKKDNKELRKLRRKRRERSLVYYSTNCSTFPPPLLFFLFFGKKKFRFRRGYPHIRAKVGLQPRSPTKERLLAMGLKSKPC